jgi:hypothetical protein
MAAHRRPTNKVGLYFRLGLSDAQPLGHLVVEKSLARHIRLHPLAIDHKLRDGTLAGVLDHFFHRARRGLDVDIFVGDVVLGQKALCLAAIGTPNHRVSDEFHEFLR